MRMANWLSVLVITTMIGVTGSNSVASAFGLPQAVSVGGTVTTPATYSVAQLQALPQVSFTVPARNGTPAHADQGVSLEQLFQSAGPVLPSDGQPPVLVPELVVPGDINDARTAYGVEQLTIAVESPSPTPPAHAGDLKIDAGLFTTVLSAAQLAVLPPQTLQVHFLAGGPTPQTHTEIGPTLDAVLAAAHIPAQIVSWVAGVGSDSYVATVTPAEAHVGGRPLLISTNEDGHALVQPRLIAAGDVKGGRYDSNLDDLVVGYPSYLGFLGLASPLPW